MFLEEMRHFMDCVEKGEDTVVSLDEGLKSLRIALAAKRSIETGAVVPSRPDPIDSEV